MKLLSKIFKSNKVILVPGIMNRFYFLFFLAFCGCQDPTTGFDYLPDNKISAFNYGTWVKPNLVTIVNDSAFVNDPSSNERLGGILLLEERKLLDSLLVKIRAGNYAPQYIDDSISDATRFFIGIPKDDGLIKIELYGNNCPLEWLRFSKTITQIRTRLGWK